MVQIMHWWPNPNAHGYLGYLSPLPAFACMAVPMMVLIDWWVYAMDMLQEIFLIPVITRLNRPYFEKSTQDALRQPDIRDLKAYYARSPSSGFWILEYGVRFIGIIAVDASLDPTPDDANPKTKKTSLPVRKSSPTATIRHFFVEEEYRTSDIQTDLLSYAVHHAFKSDDTVRQIKASDSPLAPYARETLRSTGFQLEAHVDKVGIFRWKLGIRILERAEWEKRQANTQ
jgi:hypothetical protein